MAGDHIGDPPPEGVTRELSPGRAAALFVDGSGRPIYSARCINHWCTQATPRLSHTRIGKHLYVSLVEVREYAIRHGRHVVRSGLVPAAPDPEINSRGEPSRLRTLTDLKETLLLKANSIAEGIPGSPGKEASYGASAIKSLVSELRQVLEQLHAIEVREGQVVRRSEVEHALQQFASRVGTELEAAAGEAAERIDAALAESGDRQRLIASALSAVFDEVRRRIAADLADTSRRVEAGSREAA